VLATGVWLAPYAVQIIVVTPTLNGAVNNNCPSVLVDVNSSTAQGIEITGGVMLKLLAEAQSRVQLMLLLVHRGKL